MGNNPPPPPARRLYLIAPPAFDVGPRAAKTPSSTISDIHEQRSTRTKSVSDPPLASLSLGNKLAATAARTTAQRVPAAELARVHGVTPQRVLSRFGTQSPDQLTPHAVPAVATRNAVRLMTIG